MCLWLFSLDFFPNGENLQVANWQIDTDTLIVTIKAIKIYYKEYLWDTKMKTEMNKCLFYNSLLIQIVCAPDRN